MLYVLHQCRNFFSVAHFCAAIVVFSARFGAAFCSFNFAFRWSTYVRLLSHLSLLGFVTFVSFTLRCQLFFIFLCHLFFYINSCAVSYYLSFLPPDEAYRWNVVNSTVCCSSFCCSLNYYTSILFVLRKCRNFFSVAHICAAIIKHGSKRGNKFHTSFSYTRCSVQSRISTLRRTAPSRTEVTGLNCSDHSTSLKKTGLLASYGASIRHRSRTDSAKHTMLWLHCGSLQT